MITFPLYTRSMLTNHYICWDRKCLNFVITRTAWLFFWSKVYLRRIENETFYQLKHLRHLDLSNNLLISIPDLMLCPWKPPELVSESRANAFNKRNAVVPCPAIEEHQEKVLELALFGNRWHCTCYLQKMLQNYTCMRNVGNACVA